MYVQSEYRLEVPYRGQNTIAYTLVKGGYSRLGWTISDRSFPQGERYDDEIITIKLLSSKGHALSTPRCLDEMKKKRFRPANLAELLCLGYNHPSLLSEFFIVSLAPGSAPLSQYGRAPIISQWQSKPLVYLSSCLPLRWRGRFQFAAV